MRADLTAVQVAQLRATGVFVQRGDIISGSASGHAHVAPRAWVAAAKRETCWGVGELPEADINFDPLDFDTIPCDDCGGSGAATIELWAPCQGDHCLCDESFLVARCKGVTVLPVVDDEIVRNQRPTGLVLYLLRSGRAGVVFYTDTDPNRRLPKPSGHPFVLDPAPTPGVDFVIRPEQLEWT